jgi:hypothetical protein
MLARLAPLAFLLAVCSACATVTRPPRPCSGAIWVEGTNDRYGRWHPDHWRCPNTPEEEVIVR